MPKNSEQKSPAAAVSVKLRSYYSGFQGDPAPGAIISVDAEEAQRLIDLGAAEAAKPDAG